MDSHLYTISIKFTEFRKITNFEQTVSFMVLIFKLTDLNCIIAGIDHEPVPFLRILTELTDVDFVIRTDF